MGVIKTAGCFVISCRRYRKSLKHSAKYVLIPIVGNTTPARRISEILRAVYLRLSHANSGGFDFIIPGVSRLWCPLKTFKGNFKK